MQAPVDKKKVIITEDSIRSDLRFDDAEGTACLLNEAIFEGLTCMGIRAGFSGVITPLFDTMMVQAPADMGNTPVGTHQTPIVDQPSTFKPRKKQKPKRKQRNEAEVSNDESKDEDHVPTPSSDPLPSGEDSFILNELMVFCTSLQEQVLDLQEAKAAQAEENATLKKKSKDEDHVPTPSSDPLPSGEDSFILNELMVFCTSLQEQGRINDDEMFGVDDRAGEEVVMDTTTAEHEEQIIEDVSIAEPVTNAGKVVTTTIVKDSVAPTTGVTEDEITMAQALAKLNSIKPKVVVQEQEMSTIIPATVIIVTTAVPTLRAKGKAKMIEPEVPIKKKYQMRIDEKYARRLEAEEQEAARLSRAQQDEEANNS
nr:hypothetical protein [Tanacetum cinerariifolium]